MTLDPSTRRALHMDARVRSLKEMGVEIRSSELEKSVADDLRLVDRAKSEGALGTGRKRKKKAPKKNYTSPNAARPELHAEALARKVGGEFYARPVKDEPERRVPVEKVTGVEAERSLAMQRRIKLLSKRGPGRIKAGEEIGKGPWEYPAFARQIAMTCLAFNARLGGYKGLNDKDRRRRFFRALEDICNRSDAAVGVAWWVK